METWVGWYRKEGWTKCSPQEGRQGSTELSACRATAGVGRGSFDGTISDGGEIREWIEREYGVRYKLGGTYNLLKRLGCSPKVPRGRHEKADVGVQRLWKKGGSETVSRGRV